MVTLDSGTTSCIDLFSFFGTVNIKQTNRDVMTCQIQTFYIPYILAETSATDVYSTLWGIQDFPEGGTNPMEVPTHYSYHYGRKLHENEKQMSERGHAALY